MRELPTDIRVFLSSTFTDLKKLREEISRRLHEVFGAQLIVMETFGSDDAPPEILSVRRVRECDIFIGVYARRYGTIDATTGKSVTELELEEAERALSAGNLSGILLYLLGDEAPWPSKYADTDTAKVQKLERLKGRALRHTISKFQDTDSLPFFIIRDVLAKIRHRLGAGPPQLRRFSLPEERMLNKPVGMDFLTSADRRHLGGREGKIDELLARIDSNMITLLLGNSGSGKTSLIHAGLFPVVASRGWLPIYARPLGLPRSDIATALYASIFEGPSSYRGSLVPLLEHATAAVHPRRLILIIDQFEDILTAREQDEVERLVDDLRTFRYLGEHGVRTLISYRADLEARLGQFWQLISGSPEGLPRIYLSGISPEEAWSSIARASDELHIPLSLSEIEKVQISNDLLTASKLHGEEGIYPPYIQMFIDHIWRKLQDGSRPYHFDDYLGSGRIEGVTGGYLTRVLTYAQDTEGHIRAVLASLVRSYGVKAQKSLKEVAADTGLGEERCEILLERLIDLRLVRHIRDEYEVAHDFLAQEISAKVVDSEEREFKRFRELLATKAAAFNTTRALLTVEETLMLFKHKQRVLPSDAELKLILASWARKKGPGLFWLLNGPPSRVAELARREEDEDSTDDEDRAMLVLLTRKITGGALQQKDWLLFRRYRLGIELAHLISTHPLECPDRVILLALRSKHRGVRTAAIEAVGRKIEAGHRKWVSSLGRSSSPSKRAAYEMLSLRDSISMPIKSFSARQRQLHEFVLLQEVSRARSIPEVRASLRALKRFRPRSRSWLFATGLAALRTSKLRSIFKQLPRLGVAKIDVLLSAVRGNLPANEFRALLQTYVRWNQKETEHMESAQYRRRLVYQDKAAALAQTILKAAGARDLASLRQMFDKITLTPSAQDYVLTLVRLGDTKDILRVIKKVERASNDVRYWYQIEMARTIGKRMTELGGPVPTQLFRVLAKKAFWENPFAERSRFSHRDLLRLAVRGNRTLYLRVVAHAAIGAAQLTDLGLLQKLAQHEYHMIARAAAIRLTELAGDAGISRLQATVTQAIEEGDRQSFALAVRDAEIQASGLAELW